MTLTSIGLYSNCRKKPYKDNYHAPVIGGSYGLFRGFASTYWQTGRPTIILACSDIDAFVAKTPLAKATYQSITISCWDSDTLVNVNGWVGTEDYNGQVVGGAGISRIAAIEASCGSVYSYGLRDPAVSGSLAPGATTTTTYLGWRDAYGGFDYLKLSGFSLTTSSGVYGLTYTVSINGTVVKSGSDTTTLVHGSTPNTVFSPSLTQSLPNLIDFCRIDIAVTNTSGSTWSNIKMYLYGSSIGLNLSASNPALLSAGLWTVDFDAPGITSGDLFRTLTCVTSGAGQTYVAWLVDTVAPYATATTTGTHHCELDELCNTWID